MFIITSTVERVDTNESIGPVTTTGQIFQLAMQHHLEVLVSEVLQWLPPYIKYTVKTVARKDC